MQIMQLHTAQWSSTYFKILPQKVPRLFVELQQWMYRTLRMERSNQKMQGRLFRKIWPASYIVFSVEWAVAAAKSKSGKDTHMTKTNLK